MLPRLTGLIITCVLTAYLVLDQRKQYPKKAYVIGISFFAVAFYLDSIFLLIVKGATRENMSILMQFLAILIAKGILVSVIIPMKVNVRTKECYAKKQGLSFIDTLTAVVSAFFMILAADIILGGAEIFFKLLRLILLLAVLLIYYVSVSFYERKQKERLAESEARSRKQEADIYITNVENNYQRTRELWHDLKNHINLLNVLLHEGKYEELGDYLRIFGEDVDSLTLPMKSGNLVVDALLADKLGKAKKRGVEVTLSLCDLTKLSLKPDEVCGLFGNLLDNAIEANELVVDKRFIDVDCKECETCYYIRVKNAQAVVSNTAKDENEDREKALQTSKTDMRNRVGHGLGLRSIERVVHGCGGEFVMESKEGEFIVVVRLPK